MTWKNCPFGLKLGSDNTFYHGTTKERYDTIRWEGFRVSTGINTEAAFGEGIYLTQSKYDARTYGITRTKRDFTESKGKSVKGCVIEVKLKPESKVVHVDSNPSYKEIKKMEENPPDWLKSLLEWKKEKIRKEGYSGNWEEHYEYWKSRTGFIMNMNQNHKYELAEFAKEAGCDAIHYYTTYFGKRKNKRDVWLLLSSKNVDSMREFCSIR